MSKVITYLLGLFLICFLFTIPFFQKGYFSTHDGEWAIVRLAEMRRELVDRQFPPRWSDYLNHGYGYPLFQFTYPFPYYMGSVLKLFGLGLTDSVKTLFVLSVFLSAIIMFFLGRELINTYSGFVAAIFYVTSSYRLVNLYIRGSLGESLSFVLFPLLFLNSIKITKNPNPINICIGSLFFAILILTHNVSALLFAPVYLLFLIVSTKVFHKNIFIYFKKYLLLLLFSFGLSSFFTLPLFVEKKYIELSVVKLADLNQYFINLNELFFTTNSLENPVPYELGIPLILSCGVGIISIFFNKNLHKYKLYGYFLLSLFFIFTFLSNSSSSFLWNIPPLSLVDFPMRILTPLSYLLAFGTIFIYQNKITKILSILGIIISILFNLSYISITEKINKLDEYYATNDATTTSMDELMPLWVEEKPKDRYREKVELISGLGSISKLSFSSKTINFDVDLVSLSVIQINSIYFPGWEFKVNNTILPINYQNKGGLMTLEVFPGKSTIYGVFENTPIRSLSNSITVSTIFLMVLFLIKPDVFGLNRNEKLS